MSRTRKQADPPVPRFAELCRLYARHTPDVALGSDDPAPRCAGTVSGSTVRTGYGARPRTTTAFCSIRRSAVSSSAVALVGPVATP